jgi:pilus assembly protein CpaE
MSEANARLLRQGVTDLTVDAGYLRDWTQLEAACRQARPDIVAISIDERPGQVIALVKRVRTMFPQMAFLAIAGTPPVASLVREVTEAGLADLVFLPECPKDLRRALGALAARERAPTVDGDIICLLGAKGGVGTTVLASNLAAELAARNPAAPVILVDLHVYLGDLAVGLDVQPRPSVLWFLQRGAIADAKTWAEAPPVHKAGFRVLGLDGDLASADPVSAEQVVHLCAKLKERYPFVVIDCGSEIAEVSLAACSVAKERLIVLTDELAARTGATRRRDALRALDLGPVPCRAVLNRAHEWSEPYRERLEKSCGMPLVGAVSNAWQDMQTALEKGQVLRQSAPRGAAARDLARLAEVLVGADPEEERRKKAFFNFFR